MLKDIGILSQMSMEADGEGLVLLSASKAGWSKLEIQVYCAKLLREIRSGKHRIYYDQKVVWGRKP